jgi:hypothetical protein
VREFTVKDVLLWLIREFIRVDNAYGNEKAAANLKFLKDLLKSFNEFKLLMHALGFMFVDLEK